MKKEKPWFPKIYLTQKAAIVVASGVIFLLSILYMHHGYNKEKKLLLEEITNQLEITIQKYPDIILKDMPISFGTTYIGSPDTITITTEEGVKKRYNDKKEKTPWNDFLMESLYTIVYLEEVYDSNQLNLLLQENLIKKQISVETVLYTKFPETDTEEYSGKYFSSFEPLLSSPYELGTLQEIHLQCFIKMGPFTVLKRNLYPTLVCGLSLLFCLSIFIYAFTKRAKTLREIAESLPNRQEKTLFEAFLAAPGYLLNHENIHICLWKYIKPHDTSSIRTSITRLRKALKKYPFISIENIHGEGYQLKIDQPEKNLKTQK